MVEWQNKRINQELAGFSTLCEKEWLEYFVVKGQTVGCLYPQAGLRHKLGILFSCAWR